MNMKDLIPWKSRKGGLWDPFEEMNSMAESMDRFFGRGWFPTMKLLSEPSLLGGIAQWTPQVDVKETDKEIMISASVPGVDKEDLKVELTEDTLILHGERKLDKEYEDKDGVKRMEQSYGSFTRSFVLPASVKGAEGKAVYKDGVLKIRLPKTGEPPKKQLRIE